MTRLPVYVLYEDQRGPVTQFGPHELVMSCVADTLGIDRHVVRDRLKAVPKKGDAKLYAACKTEVGRLGARGQPVVALFDDDKIRALLKVASTLPKRDVARRIVQESDQPQQLVVRLLEKNMETVVVAAAVLLGEVAPPKSIQERERLLQRIAWDMPSRRAAVREQVPTFDCFVQVIAALLQRT